MAKFKLEVSENAGATYRNIATSDDVGELLDQAHKHEMWVIADENGKQVGASRVPQHTHEDTPHSNS